MRSLLRASIFVLVVAASACGALRAPAHGDPELDPLYAELALAASPEEAARLTAQIEAAWSASGSPTVDVLLDRAAKAQSAGRGDLAETYLDEAARLAPDVPGVYARRAAIAFAREDLEGALRDIEETLRREPRHYEALLGLGAISERLGRNDAALKAYQDALVIHPHLEPARQGVERLTPKVEGENI